MLFCVLGIIALHFMIPLGSISSWTLLICGVALITLGLVMAFGAEGQFRKRGTTVDHLGMASKLVTDGWFQYSRNPIYLSFLTILVGTWLSLGSLTPLLVILIYLLLTERWYILPEEKRLLASFGKKYLSYQMRTRRWL
jgi:protein-S-isoprenylcysteine O-methyltransferase Ste14